MDILQVSRESLGCGGYGDIVLGELLPPDRRAGTKVAVKQLRGTGTKAECERTAIVSYLPNSGPIGIKPYIRQVFARELKVWAGVEHPHIVPLVGFHLSKSRDIAWLISPYMKHGNIREYLSGQKTPRLTRMRLVSLESISIYPELKYGLPSSMKLPMEYITFMTSTYVMAI